MLPLPIAGVWNIQMEKKYISFWDICYWQNYVKLFVRKWVQHGCSYQFQECLAITKIMLLPCQEFLKCQTWIRRSLTQFVLQHENCLTHNSFFCWCCHHIFFQFLFKISKASLREGVHKKFWGKKVFEESFSRALLQCFFRHQWCNVLLLYYSWVPQQRHGPYIHAEFGHI